MRGKELCIPPCHLPNIRSKWTEVGGGRDIVPELWLFVGVVLARRRNNVVSRLCFLRKILKVRPHKSSKNNNNNQNNGGVVRECVRKRRIRSSSGWSA